MLEFAARQNAGVEAGMAKMSEKFKETGGELYMGADGRERG